MISEQQVMKQRQGVFATTMDGEVGILHPEKGNYYMLNPSGADAWGHLETPKSVSQLVEEMLKEYDIDKETCTTEIGLLCEQLLAEDLLEICK